MMRSLYSGVSGLKNHQIRMDVIGDNISNVNTIGFKGSRVMFQTILSQMIKGAAAPQEDRGGTNPQEVGLGMMVASIDKLMHQGNLQSTGKNTDVAIQGNGFFIVTNGEKRFYTRAGDFNVDGKGYLVNPQGMRVLGWMPTRDASGNWTINTAAELQEIRIPVGEKIPAKATSKIRLRCNLDSRVSVLPPEFTMTVTDNEGQVHHLRFTINYNRANDQWIWTLAQDTSEAGGTFPTGATGTITRNPDGTIAGITGFPLDLDDGDDAGPDIQITATVQNGNLVFSVTGANGGTGAPVTIKYNDKAIHYTSIEAYDSLGNTHRLTLRFEKVDANQNLWRWHADVENGTITAGGAGYVEFNADGSLANFTYDGGANGITIQPTGGASAFTIQVNPGTVGQFDGITQLASQFTTQIVEQDGYGLGVLETFSIDDRGVITGIFTNGQTRPLGQIALAMFTNPAGLNKVAGTLFDVSSNSGLPLIGEAGVGGRGTIAAGMLEMSNVDLASEFVDMIVTQRGFQANSRVITTTDQMLQELLTLKR